jgi:hypothetical protein
MTVPVSSKTITRSFHVARGKLKGEGGKVERVSYPD